MVPAAAAPANGRPWFSARNNAIGADVSGNPTSHPLTAGPQRRPARLAAPINVGVRTSFRTSVSTRRYSRSPLLGMLPESHIASMLLRQLLGEDRPASSEELEREAKRQTSVVDLFSASPLCGSGTVIERTNDGPHAL